MYSQWTPSWLQTYGGDPERREADSSSPSQHSLQREARECDVVSRFINIR